MDLGSSLSVREASNFRTLARDLTKFPSGELLLLSPMYMYLAHDVQSSGFKNRNCNDLLTSLCTCFVLHL